MLFVFYGTFYNDSLIPSGNIRCHLKEKWNKLKHKIVQVNTYANIFLQKVNKHRK